MDDLLREFLTETNESLSLLDNELVALEQNPNDPSLLSDIFRAVHTIKGTCGFLGLPRLEKVAHASENILGKFRDGDLSVTPYSVTLILASLDRIKMLLAALEQTGKEPDGQDGDLIDKLNSHADGRDDGSESEFSAGLAGSPAAETQSVPTASPPSPVPAASAMPATPSTLSGTVSSPIPPPEPDEFGFVPMTAEQLARQAESEMAQENNKAVTPPPPPSSVRNESLDGDDGASKSMDKKAEGSLASQSLRVSVDVLEGLMTMVSELVLIRNQMLQILRTQKDTEFTSPLQRLNHVTSDLQEQVMKTRMQPIGNAWAKLPRIVRDLAHELGKKIDLQMLGADTELDRQVLDMIKDPLTHMVRNSADHGLESPAERLAAGKKETGRVTLNAYHEGGHILIEVSDDGRGLNSKRIREKILRNGLSSENELAGMSDQQIQQYIFRAGFSTAAEVTAVSGRGVGMDVVRTNIEKIGGTIEMRSVEGKGTTFIIKIPLTLAIVSALIVESAGERFAIPQISVLELVRAGGKNSDNTIEKINGAPVMRLRNRLLPLVLLHELLRLPASKRTQIKDGLEIDIAHDSFRDSTIVVTQVGQQTFGIIVDRVFDTEEIVVKPVAPILRHIEMFSGNTILGDGSVIMILDPNGIASATGNETLRAQTQVHEEAHKEAQRRDAEKLAMLLFRAGDRAPKAVPLSLVARLEEIDVASIEYSGGQPMVQYRGRLMPLLLPSASVRIREEGMQPVLVFADHERSMGLIVDEIIDIVEERLDVQIGAHDKGLMGSAIIAGKSTDVLDAGFYLSQAFSDWFGKTDAYKDARATSSRKILLIDDSAFFRNMLTPLLSVTGYQVTAVAGAQEALNLCREGVPFDLIVSDIEMPGMSGFEFAEALKKDGGIWANVPLIALSSHATPVDVDRGRKAGFVDHVAKFDREGLISTLNNTLNLDMKGAA